MVEAVAVRRPRLPVAETLGLLAGAAGIGALAAALSYLLYRHPPSLLIIAGFAFVMLGSLALAIFAFDTAVAVGVLLLAAVRFQPAPTDVVFAVLMAVAFATGRFSLRRLTAGPLLLAGAFLAFNLVSMIDVVDGLRAVQFLGITIYVLIFALWLASTVTEISIARRITRWYVVGAVISALLSSLALIVPYPGHDVFTRIGRAEGLFKDPNVFGPFLVPAALILLEEILMPRLFSWRRTTKVLVFLTLAVGVLFSYSRAAWLNLAVGLAVMVVVFSFRRGAGKQAARAVALVLVACVALGAVVSLHRLPVVPRAAREGADLRQQPLRGAVREHQMGGAPPVRARAGAIRARTRTSPTHSMYAAGARRGRRPGIPQPADPHAGHARTGRGGTPSSGATPTGSARRRCSARGSARSSTASSWTRCTGAISGFWRR